MEETPEARVRHSHHRKKKRRKLDVVMDFLPSQDALSCPFVGYFPSGFDPTQYDARPLSKNGHLETGLNVSAYQNTERYKTKQYQLVVTPPHGSVDFVGTNYLGEGAMWQPGNYALGVFDKESQTLKLVPLGGTKVLRMEPRVRGLDYGDSIPEAVPVAPSSKEIMLQKKNLLTSTFGTQKSRVRLNRKERGHVKEEALGDKAEIGRLFEKAGTNLSILTSQEALQRVNAAVTRNIPPHDATATTPDRAYLFNEIITLEEQNSLSDVTSLIAAARNPDKARELCEENLYPDFVIKHLHKLNIENDEEGNTKRAVIMSYIRHLLAFYNLPRPLIKSIVDPVGYRGDYNSSKAIDLRSHSNIPNAVAVKILKLFTTIDRTRDEEVRIQTVDNRNLLISYILLLGLMLDNYKADPFDLALELKMTISKLKPHYMELGCKYQVLKGKDRPERDSLQRLYKVVLRVPLEFPQMTTNTRRRK